jgi:3-phenylpropionate/trans-cinnamate dioxygenase ferredoxin subunit
MEIQFIVIGRAEEIPVGTTKCLDILGRGLLVAHLEDGFYAVENRCSHAASPLDGRRVLKGGQIMCPLHGARFDLRTGAAKTAPAFRGIPTYPARIVDGQIEVAVPPRLAPIEAAQPFGGQIP